jgi:hypothetical protein
MITYICLILTSFASCFARNASFTWFVAMVLGLAIRTDKLGVTSVVRDLSLKPEAYTCLLHFFKADSWRLSEIRQCWYRAIRNFIPLLKETERFLLVADGVKQSKEARRMPGVKRLHQESETQTKPDTIFGHMWGGVGVLAGVLGKMACIPASLRIHDGLQDAAEWEGSWLSAESHVVQMIRNCCEAAQVIGHSFALMDRYFLSVPALMTLREENKRNSFGVEMITKAKKSCVAYREPPPRVPGQKGRPRLKGECVKVATLFETMKSAFVPARIEMYGKLQDVCFYCIDLLWGKKLYQPLRFVLVKMGATNSILVSTRLDLDPETIIRLYSYRFRIETMFRELKQQIGGFAYRFWTKSLAKLNHFRKKTEPSPLASITLEKDRGNILRAVRAIEMHALVASIAMGIVQAVSLKCADSLAEMYRWQRTPCKEKPSEANVMHCLRRQLYAVLAKSSKNSILHLIQQHQTSPWGDSDSWVA